MVVVTRINIQCLALNKETIQRSTTETRNFCWETIKWTVPCVLTLSCSLYHVGAGSSKTTSASGSETSPRKSFRPNMSACHTLSHSVREDSEASVCAKLSVSSKTGFRVFFFTFVLRLPAFDLSGNR